MSRSLTTTDVIPNPTPGEILLLDFIEPRYFGLSDGFWLGLQSDHDLLRQRRKIAADLQRIAPRAIAA
jgi:plasmid maintenance system antidote protein VapI